MLKLPKSPACFSLLMGAGLALVLSAFVGSQTPVLAATLPVVRQFILSSGHKVYIVEQHSQPVVTVDTWVATGSVNETNANNGVSHFLEHLLFKGSKSFATGTLERRLDSQGCEYNAATSQDYTHYYITLPSFFMQEALTLHASMLQEASFPPEEVDRERLVVTEEINRSKGQPTSALFELLDGAMFPGHGYSRTTLGPKENIANIPHKDIKAYYQHWYRPQDFSTIVVGDVNPKEVLAQLEQAFKATAAPEISGAAASYTPPKVGGPKALTAPQVLLKADPSVSRVLGCLAFIGPSLGADPKGVVALDAAFEAFGGDDASRLVQRLRNQKQLVQSISAGNLTQKHTGVMYVLFETEPAKLEAAVEAIKTEVQALRQEGLNADELRRVQRNFEHQFVFLTEDTQQVANTLGYNVALGQLSDFTEYLNRVNKLSLPVVKQQLQSWLDWKGATLVALLPAPPEAAAPTPALEKTAKSKKKNKKESAATPPEVKSFSAAEQDALQARLLSSLQKQVEEAATLTANAAAQPKATSSNELKAQERPNPFLAQKELLSNGITFLSKDLPENNTFSLQIYIPGGLLSGNKAGVEKLYSRLMPLETQRYNEADLQALFSEQGISLSFSNEPNYTKLSLTAANTALGEALALLDEVLLHPKFSPALLKREQTLLIKGITNALDQPAFLASTTLQEQVYPANHPYGRTGRRLLPELAKLTVEDLQAYHSSLLQSRKWIVSLAGHVDTDYIRNYLTHLPMPQGEAWQWAKTSVPAYGQPDTSQPVAVLRAEQPAYQIAMAWPVAGLEAQEASALRVLNGVLGSGMSSRLFVNLREKRGLAYTVNSSYPLMLQKGTFNIYMGTDKANLTQALDGLNKEIENLITTPLSETELNEVKAKLLGQFRMAHQGPAELAFYPGFYEAVGLGAPFEANFEGLLEGVTAEQVQAVAKRYFSVKPVTVLVGPALPMPEVKPAAEVKAPNKAMAFFLQGKGEAKVKPEKKVKAPKPELSPEKASLWQRVKFW